MRPNVVVKSEDFLVFTKPDDFTDPQARSYAASHAARFGIHKDFKPPVKAEPEGPRSGLLTWRSRPKSQAVARTKPVARRKAKVQQRSRLEVALPMEAIPASLTPNPSLQHFFQANPFCFYPAQILIEAGTPAAVAAFPAIDLKNVYHGVMGMCMGWLATQFPTQYSLDAARYHQAQAIPLLRQRLRQPPYDEATHLAILCAMQTAAILGDKNDLVTHERGLENFSRAMGDDKSDYCKLVQPRHNTMGELAAGRPPSVFGQHLQGPEMRIYLNCPTPVFLGRMITLLPQGFQDMVFEQEFFDLDTIRYWAHLYSRTARIASNTGAGSKNFEFDIPMYARILELRRILSTLDYSSSLMKRFICQANYLYMSVMYYRHIMQDSPIFQSFRNEAKDFVYRYKPGGPADINLLLYNSLLIIHTWKNGPILERDGSELVVELKRRFPQFRDWEAVQAMLRTKFNYLPPILAEWKNSWEQAVVDDSRVTLLPE